jgi:hypothetical protein
MFVKKNANCSNVIGPDPIPVYLHKGTGIEVMVINVTRNICAAIGRFEGALLCLSINNG